MKKLFVILCFLSIYQTTYSIYLKNIGMGDGLSQVSVMSIHQDRLGRMWFGTREGINIYDGERMKSYKDWGKKNEDSKINILMGHPCDFITENKNGDLFFRTSDAMVKYDIRRETFRVVSENTHTIASYKGEIWSAFENTIFKYDETGDSLFTHIKTDLPNISCLQISENKVWVGTHYGLYIIDQQGKIRCLLEEPEIYRLFESSSGDLWVGTGAEGLYKISPDEKITYYSETSRPPYRIENNQIREFIEDKSGNIWFGTFMGLHCYHPNTGGFTFYRQDHIPGSLSHSSVYSLYIDKQGTIWAGTYYGGVNYFNPEKDIFNHYISNPSREDCLSHPFVGHMAEDKEDNIWICTEGGGLNFMDRKTRTFKYFKAGQNNSVLQNNLKNITYDEKRNKLYIGTHLGGLSRYDINTGIFHNYLNDYTDEYSMPCEIIFHTMLYRDKLYVSARNGTFVMDPDTDEFRWVCRNAQNFTIDSKGYIWIIIGMQLIRQKLDDPENTKTYRLPQYNIHYEVKRIVETHNGDIYFVALGSGLYRYDKQTDSFIRYSLESGHLLSNYCYNITETNQDELLITSDKGVTFFNPATGNSRFTKLGANLPITSITDGCGILICRNNELFLGGSDGLTSFRREDLDKKEIDYSLYFSELYIHNEKIYPGNPDHVLKETLPYSQSISLSYKQNNIILEFASTNYIDIQKNNEFEYRLEGFDQEWIPTSRTSIHYTNLNPGKYKLKVREKDVLHSTDENREISLGIIIARPWYNTIWAWAIYILIVIMVSYFIIRTKNARRELALSLEREREEKERNEELNQAKLQFFTNISHEFRTPLTLIISQIDLLFRSTSLSPGIYNKIIKISKNANQMRNMISELLEFRKIEQNHVFLNISEQDIISFLKEIYFSYYELAVQQNITFRLEDGNSPILLWFDPSQLQKVFNNLLSNAFKYTKNGGSIELFVENKETEVCIKVIDSGIGLSEIDVSRIFDRFYQATNGRQFSNSNPGTGIGLALSKSIILLHHGEIAVQSNLGYGTIFTVRLPKGKSHFEQDQKCTILEKPGEAILEPDTLPNLMPETEEDGMEDIFPEMEKGTRYAVLIVEDNEELLQTLNTLFTPFYDVISAGNGEEGLRLANEKRPDLIISDVMMPVMSGIEMCMKIKNNINLCHIPVVLLTALNTVDHNIEGLRLGADDYISKPFHSRVLLMRCNNLIKNRLLIKNKFSKQIDFDTQLLAVSPLDQKLMTHISEIIDKHIANPDFDVNTFARELGMGRSSLFTKLKDLTGMTPNEFIQNQRIKRAATLLRKYPDMRVNEIADQLGFISTVYFSRCFKTQIGMSPLQYRKGG
jgi:signal transduction histidine kinase/ligand-binding sensor domain-containing protein/CheY-like chemotaxis protein/AraC-like DNA-binding protein